MGLDPLDHRSEPTLRTLVEAGATDVVVTDDSTCALRVDGITCWGLGESQYEHLPRQFGLGTEPSWGEPSVGPAGLQAPGAVPDDSREPWAVEAEGLRFRCGRVAADGPIVCEGSNEQGQLGVDPPVTPSPERIATGVDEVTAAWDQTCYRARSKWTCVGHEPSPMTGAGIEQVALGRSHACVLRGGGVACVGDLGDGQLGIGRPPPAPAPASSGLAGLLEPSQMIGMFGNQSTERLHRVPVVKGALAVAVTDRASCALTGDGVLCWGQLEPIDHDIMFRGGPCPGGEECDAARTPRLLPASGGATELVATADEVCFRRSPTEVRCGVQEWRDPVVASDGRLVAGVESICAVGRESVCWGTGRNPTAPPSPIAPSLTAWAGGDGFACFAGRDGLRCQGRGDRGQLGGGRLADRYARPPETHEVLSVSSPRALAAGRGHACAIDGAGALWCWGSRRGFRSADEAGVAHRSEPGLVPLP